MSTVSELKTKVSRAASAGASALAHDEPANAVVDAARAAAEKISDAASNASEQITDAANRLNPRAKRKRRRLHKRLGVGLGALGLSLAAILGLRRRESSTG
jgi:cell division septum initiation protein DivIVA